MKLTLKIEQDTDPLDPRENFDHVGTMVCWHGRYNLGDDVNKAKLSSTEFMKTVPKDSIILPVYLYDHSGLTMNTTGFSCPWDSGQVGWIFCTMDKARKEWSGTDEEIRSKAMACLRAEVEEYDQYLTGDVWGFTIEDETGEDIESCWGFYGHEACKEQGEEALKHYNAKYANVEEETQKAECWL